MPKIRLGIIGAGDVAREHLKVLAESDDFEVAGLTARTSAKAQALLSQHHWKCFYGSLDEMMDRASLEALMILVNEESMFDVTMKAMAYGVPLFIEKPAGLTPQLNAQLALEAKSKGIKTMVGYNRRYYSIFHKGLEMIRQHGPLLGIAVEGHERIWRVKAAGKFSETVLEHWIYANSTHTIDLLRFFGGEMRDCKVLGHAYKERTGDQFAAVARFENGALGTYQAHWHSPGGWRVALYGDGVTVEFKPLESGRWIDKDFQAHDIIPDEVDVKFKPGFFRQMEAFAQLIYGGKGGWPLQDLSSAHKTMAFAETLAKEIIC